MIKSVFKYLEEKSELIMFVTTVMLLFLTMIPIALCLPLIIRHLIQIVAMMGFLIGFFFHKDKKLFIVYCVIMAVMLFQTYQVWQFKKSFSSCLFNVFTDWTFAFYGLVLYRLKSSKYQKYLLITLIVVVTITAVTTIIGLFSDPLAVRELGRSNLSYDGVTGDKFAKIKWGYRLRNIAGWNQLYGMVFVIPCILFMYKKTKNYLYLGSAIICTICVLQSQLMFALLLTILMIVFSFVKPSFKKKPLLIEGGILAIVIVFLDDLVLLASRITASLKMATLPSKLYDFYQLLNGVDKGSALARTNVYSRSIEIFQKHPFIGQAFYGVNDKIMFSYHSDILDMLAFLGIVGGVLIIATIVSYLLYMKRFEHRDQWLIVLLLVGFVIFSSINPVWYSPQVFVGAFLMPALIANTFNRSVDL